MLGAKCWRAQRRLRDISTAASGVSCARRWVKYCCDLEGYERWRGSWSSYMLTLRASTVVPRPSRGSANAAPAGRVPRTALIEAKHRSRLRNAECSKSQRCTGRASGLLGGGGGSLVHGCSPLAGAGSPVRRPPRTPLGLGGSDFHSTPKPRRLRVFGELAAALHVVQAARQTLVGRGAQEFPVDSGCAVRFHHWAHGRGRGHPGHLREGLRL